MQTTQKNSKTAPVKMIWFLVSIGICLSCFLSLIGVASGRNAGRAMGDVFVYCVPYMMMALAAGLCMSRGCINLSLPGTMILSALVFGACLQNGMPFFPAMLLSMLTGAISGALNGIFTIQRSKSIKLVTALSSLLVGIIGSGFVFTVSRGEGFKISTDRSMTTICCIIWIVMSIGICFAGAVKGGKQFRTFEGDVSAVSAGNRFLWTMIAGILASLAGVYRSVQYGYFTYSSSYDLNYMMDIFLILLAAGILIPNMKKNYSEALFGYLAIVFSALSFGALYMTFARMSLDSGVQNVAYAVLGLLLVIPNILIYKQKKDPAGEENTDE